MNSTPHTGKANEITFQNDMLRHLIANGWQLGKAENYHRELALYPSNPEQKLLERVDTLLNKANPNAVNAEQFYIEKVQMEA
ncbi:hypothetical protein [Nitrosomonas sp.]|uniref:hypothetical protein n=1 Tax=Nitrosomonas sp. TaxID=42353 RepID=UPI00272F4D5B|nr:hypothetical protein [Nitrosomonas sp.]MDP2225631.1 hypothetical protein [Nitrosomonas sp.]